MVLHMFRSVFKPIHAVLIKHAVLDLLLVRGCVFVCPLVVSSQSGLQDFFFEYHFNNMLHALVESLIQTIIDSGSPDLKHAVRLLTDV